MQSRKFLPSIIILASSLTIWLTNLHHYFSLDYLRNNQQLLQYFVVEHYVKSLFFYIGIYVIIVALSLPLASFMTIIGGFFFGQWVGAIAVVSSATLGSCLFFLSIRLATSNLIHKKSKQFSQMQKGLQENALFYLLTLRLMPLFPFTAINLAAAFFQVPLKIFVLATFLGIIPGSFIYVSAGVALQEIINQSEFSLSLALEPKLLLSLTGLGILSLLPVFYKYLQKHK